MTFYYRRQFFLKCNSEKTKKASPRSQNQNQGTQDFTAYTIISLHQRTGTNTETYFAEKLKNTSGICLREIAQPFLKWSLHIAFISLGCCNKHKRLDSLNNRIYFSHFWRMEVWDQVPKWLDSDENTLPGLHVVAFLLHLQMAFSWV